jgi:hypothetical protein
MRNFGLKISATLILSCILFFISCKKDTLLTTGGKVTYSVDTFKFDTVFTQQGSSTRTLKIFNKENQRLNIASIRFKNGERSRFYFNINGKEGKSATNVTILAKDSIYAFLGVNIDPNNEDEPFVVYDELISTVNGEDYILPIIAYGQNAIYIMDSVLTTQTWNDKKPYVIINNALVDEGATLTIAKGTKVYVHANSRLFVSGTLKINGTLDEPVIFQGDRLDRLTYIGDYFGVSGEWGGIYFLNTSHNNEINYAQFINGGASTKLGNQVTMAATIQLDKDTIQNSIPKLKITNSKIQNSQGYGILAFNSSLYAENVLVAECGSENIALLEGGNYEINNSTFVSYGWKHLNRNNSRVASFTNFLAIDQVNFTAAPLKLSLNNSIIWGSYIGELLCAKVDNVAAEIKINNSLVKFKAEDVESFVELHNTINNSDPLFKVVPSGSNYTDWDFRLTEASPAKHSGAVFGSLNTDLNGIMRNQPPSMGCYEYINE